MNTDMCDEPCNKISVEDVVKDGTPETFTCENIVKVTILPNEATNSNDETRECLDQQVNTAAFPFEEANLEDETSKCFQSPSPTLLHNNTDEPREITKVISEFQGNNCFTKGCKWSPDGSCLLTNSNDSLLRIWNLPASLYNKQSWCPKTDSSVDLKTALSVKEGGMVYDYCWYPLMSSWDPSTCCFATASRGNPGHLWDAYTGTLRATYRAYNQVDEVEPARCVAIDPTGEHLYFGFNNNFRVFRTALPGRECNIRNLKDVSHGSQCGIVSCISVNPSEPNLYAVGTYLKTIGLYSESEENVLCVLRGHEGGLTHLLFSPDGLRLYSGARTDSEIVCWDLREPGKVLFSVPRKVTTHQRIYFDLTPNGKFLVSGTIDGCISVWDTQSALSNDEGLLEPIKTFRAHGDCTNGISAHPFYTILASCSGQRHFVRSGHSSSESGNSDDDTKRSDTDSVRIKRTSKVKWDYSLKLWWSGPIDQD